LYKLQQSSHYKKDLLTLLASIQEAPSLTRELWMCALSCLLYILTKSYFCMHIHKHSPSCKANQSLLRAINNEDKLENILFIYNTVETQDF